MLKTLRAFFLFIKDWYIAILVIGFVFFIVGGAIYTSFIKKTKIIDPQKTIGTVIGFETYTKGINSVIEFYVNGKTFKVEGSQINGEIIGEKYEVFYEKNEPSIAKANMMNPVFESNENKNKTKALITMVFKLGTPNVRFEYSINGVKYERWQECDLDKYKDVESGQYYEIEYWVENPQRAIIYLNNPINEGP